MELSKGHVIQTSCLVLLLITSGCFFSSQRELRWAAQMEQDRDYDGALKRYETVILQESKNSGFRAKAAMAAARIENYQNKDYVKALSFYRRVILDSDSQQERIEAQKQIITILFDHQQNYKEALLELTKFISTYTRKDQIWLKYKLDIARAFFHLDDLNQALSEIQDFLSLSPGADLIFEATLLKGNILLNQKKLKEARLVFEDVLKNHTDMAIKENVPVILSVVLEDSNDFNGAIEVLNRFRPQMAKNEYLELRIKRLEERKRNAPGYRGFRK